jgi:GNAT superfamily N-acetyltransferase
LQAGDEPRLQEFFHSHTEETIHERYGGTVTTMTPERASSLVNVDQTRDCALGIFSPDGEKLLAVGRYCLDPDAQGAELAFVVRETMRRRGLATGLLERLIATARERGLRRLWGQTNVHNAAMLGIFRRHHFEISTDAGTGEALATLTLNPKPTTPFP